ncbi:MAG: polysaccharide biosynthesis tyrosine autokinase [Acidobacteria bacterium]|nr:MAG: polysaccharide biosynthesis tyrosine autokinase [Acidobacteriota bacterium]
MSDTQQPPSEHDAVTSRAEPQWQLEDVFAVLYKRRWIALFTFLIAAAGVVTYTMSVTPIYEAHTQLLLQQRASIVTFEGAADPQANERGYLETQHRLLRSRSLARRVIDALNLWDLGRAPADGNAQPAGTFAFLGQWRSWLGRAVGAATGATSSQEKEPGSVRETVAESIAIDRLLANLRILPVRDTRIIEVRYESPDPELAARVVNTLATTYITHNLEVQSQASKEATTWLAEQLAEQRRKVEVSELALQKYRERENSLSLEAGQNIVVQRLNSLNASVTQAKTDLIAVESLYRQLAASQRDQGALDTFPLIRSNGVVQEIRGRLANLQRERMQLASNLGAKHPEMVRVNSAIEAAERELDSEVAKTVESVRQEYLAALSREKELTAELDAQKSRALALNRQGIEYGVLLREVESNRQIYQNLLQRSNETAVSKDIQGPDIQVVDAAEVPRRPVRPDTRSTLMIGLLLSGILAVAIAFIREAFDSRLQTPSAVRALGIPFLGMLPYVGKRALKGRSLLLTHGVPAPYAEACRALRTNVLASAGGGTTGRSLLVTSAAPGDGKSIVAVNLAVALGRSGGRVLVIDADLRRPVLHQVLECEQRPGLAEVLTGKRKPSEAIVATRSPGVWLLPSGAGIASPSEQLGSRRFSEFLARVGESFDWVIIDSPPVMAVTDPSVMAHLASGVLFVVNARHTKQRVAQAALDQLETAGATFAGAVLNAVTLDRDHYYNSRYYLPFYGDYLTDKRSA